jgi:hypothetical protein
MQAHNIAALLLRLRMYTAHLITHITCKIATISPSPDLLYAHYAESWQNTIKNNANRTKDSTSFTNPKCDTLSNISSPSRLTRRSKQAPSGRADPGAGSRNNILPCQRPLPDLTCVCARKVEKLDAWSLCLAWKPSLFCACPPMATKACLCSMIGKCTDVEPGSSLKSGDAHT